MNIEIIGSDQHVARLKVVGVGGCGGNLVSYMSERPASGVEYVAINTDTQALKNMRDNIETIQIGGKDTRGLGAGGAPEVARKAALDAHDRLREVLRDMDMVFVVAGMGKGTGTGASPVVAELAREMGVLTVALVVMPFNFENRAKQAEAGLVALSKHADSLIVAPNERLMDVLGEEAEVSKAYIAANDLLYNAVCGVSDIINKHGEVNVDFNDVRTAMAGKGKAVIGSAVARGPDRAILAAQNALGSDLMESADLSGASHILVNLSGRKMLMKELKMVVELLGERVPDLRGQITQGMAEDENAGEELRVTIVVTGLSERYQPKMLQPPEDGGDAPAPQFESGRRGRGAEADGKPHRQPAVLRQQTN